MSRPPLRDHQVADKAWMEQVGRGLLANEPGTGKTRPTIEHLDGARVLVVAPSLVLAGGTWDDELERWADHPDLFQQAPYTHLNDRAKTGKGSGTKPIKRLREEYQGKYDALVIDEAHYIKGRDTSWTWAVQDIAKRVDTIVALTGTPVPNWAHELFTTLQVIHGQTSPGQRFGSFWRWAGEWFDTTPTRFSNGMPVVGQLLGCMRARGACEERPATDPCEHWTAFVEANLGGHYRRVLRDDVLDLPPLTQQEVLVPLDAAGKKAYRQLKKDFATTIDGQEVLAWSQGAKNVLLDKLTTSPWLLTQEGPPRGGKLERLRFDLESRSRPTLVLAHYRDSVEACAEVATSLGASTGYVHGGHKDADAVKAFKAGRLDVLVGSLETLAEGLTLTRADVCIFVEKSYKPSRNEQALRRIHRFGQDRPCTSLDYVTPGTVDAAKRRLLATKTDQQMRMLTAAEFLELL